jgi:L-ascorbate metabolism protein UlaG (beta-lactamase superfamily)
VVGSPSAAKVAEALGYTQVTGLLHGEVYALGDQITIQATPGSLVGPNTVENGYFLKDLHQNQTLYYEPHGSHPPMLKDLAPIDVVITPMFDLSLPLIGPIIRGSKAAVEIAEWIQPQVLVATTAPGKAHYEGMVLSFLKATGGPAIVEQELDRLKLKTKVVDPVSGERFALDLKDLKDLNCSPTSMV